MSDIRIKAKQRRDHLLSRIERLVPIEEVTTRIAGDEVPWIRVKDPDHLLLKALESGEQGDFHVDPFWAASWRAAEGMDQFVGRLCRSTPQEDWQNLRILELGGGSGRAGISAAMRGASVLITDAATTGMLVCRCNAWHVQDRARIRKLDWRDRTGALGCFPVILGSDIVYDTNLFPILEPCMRRHLSPGGAVYLSEPQRHTGQRFKSWIQAAGWKIREHFIDLNDSEREIRVFECRLP